MSYLVYTLYYFRPTINLGPGQVDIFDIKYETYRSTVGYTTPISLNRFESQISEYIPHATAGTKLTLTSNWQAINLFPLAQYTMSSGGYNFLVSGRFSIQLKNTPVSNTIRMCNIAGTLVLSDYFAVYRIVNSHLESGIYHVIESCPSTNQVQSKIIALWKLSSSGTPTEQLSYSFILTDTTPKEFEFSIFVSRLPFDSDIKLKIVVNEFFPTKSQVI